MKDLIEILTWCRGAGTRSEAEFVRRYIATINGIWPDEYGNYHLTLGGEDARILWSCHTDTVTRKEGRQNVKWLGKGLLGLHNPQIGQCLGADDGAGLWIMLELIKHNKPGHYVFHRDEEIGGLGSSWIAKNAYVIPDTIMAAIAMDRCGTQDIITHQGWQRTASNEFAKSLQAQLPAGMVPDDTGVFTDTANYTDLIGECTNLACGYERNHGPQETLDTKYLMRLRDALLELDTSKLEYVRQPGELEYGGWSDYGHGYYGSGSGTVADGVTRTRYPSLVEEDWDEVDENTPPFDDIMSFEDMVRECPGVASRLMDELGVTREEFRAHVFALTGRLLQ